MSISSVLNTPHLSSLKSPSVLPKHYSKVLENGLEVVVIPLHNQSGVIESNVFYKVGSRNEALGKSGIAHMLEHLSFKSTAKLKAGEFDEIVKGFGGVNNASTSFDYTRYFIKSSVENLDKSLELFAELMSSLRLEDSEFQPERDVVSEERLWRTDNSPIGYLYFRFFNTAFVYHPYHWTPIGFMEDIKSWKIEDIREFYRTYYQPQNAIVLVSGDVESQSVFESAARHFGALKNHAPIPQVSAKEPAQDGMRRSIVRKDSQVEYLAMGYKVPDFTHEDQVAINVLGEILSSGKSSILQKELVDRLQIASSAYAYAMNLKDENVFLFMSVAQEGVKAEQLESEIRKIIESIKRGDITQEELDRVKINTRAAFIYGLESASSVAGLFGGYLARGDLKPLLEYEQRLNALSLEQIQAVAQKYFNDDALSVVILKDKEK